MRACIRSHLALIVCLKTWRTARGEEKRGFFSKEAKIPRTTVWRNEKKVKEIAGGISDSPITTMHHIDDFIEGSAQSSCSMFDNQLETSTGSDDLSTRPPMDTEHVIDPLFGDERSNEDSTGEFLSLLFDMPTESSSNSDTSDESDSDIELFNTSSDSEHEDETSDFVEDVEKSDNETSDDDVPLYEGANVSKLGALILVMLFSLRQAVWPSFDRFG